MTESVAVIDLGSNSARLVISNIYHNGAYNLVYNQKESVRLSEGMEKDNCLQPAAIERAIRTLNAFAHMCQIHKADKIIAVTTAAVRNARNGQEFIQLVKDKTNIDLEIISGEKEAKIGSIAVTNTIDIRDALLFDLGGGSTELTLIRDHKVVELISIPFGAITLTEKFKTQDKVSNENLTALTEYIKKTFAAIPWLQNLKLPLVGIGGTARNIAKMDQRQKNYPFPKIHNYRMGMISFENLWQTLIRTNLNQRRKLPGLSSERADIIIAGINIVKTLFEVSAGTQFIVSGSGLREGLFMHYYLQRENQPDVLPDILMHSTRNMLLFYKGNTLHAYHVSYLALSLFDGWKDLLQLTGRERTLLKVAAFLHDIGITINYYDHTRHTAYLVENARLFGLTHREQMLVAVVAGWHHGMSGKAVRRNYYEFLDEADWSTARKLALLLSLAESLDETQMHRIQSVSATIENDKAKLTLKTFEEDALIERQSAEKHTKWFRKEMQIPLIIE
ncbi:MAG: exopolyphosphatase [Sporomusaceae bacterium]|nr:exopolyphosphatase [Sporomusaceae bacterium]